MQVNPYLYYSGNCEAALKYYEKALGAKIEMMMTHESAPAEMPTPPEWKKKIMHARATIGGAVIMASDAPPGHFQKPQGSSVCLLAQDRAARYADAVVRHQAQHQRAGRQARPVDHDPLAGGADALEQIEERTDLTARTGEDADLGLCLWRGEGEQHDGEKDCLDDRRSHRERLLARCQGEIVSRIPRGKVFSVFRAGNPGLAKRGHPATPRERRAQQQDGDPHARACAA